jgi:DNA polymerase-1
MKIISTNLSEPESLSNFERDQVYNGLDCCVTSEVFEMLRTQLDDATYRTYEFSKALQGPVLEMRLRGVRIDNKRRWEVVEDLYEQVSALEETLDEIVSKGLGFYGFNWRSNDDLKHLFYDCLNIPPIMYMGKPTVNRKALEKLGGYLEARPIANILIAMRDIAGKIKTLKTVSDDDDRIRTSYKIAGTDTGRFSSSLSEFGTGGNLQNIEESLRSIFIADEGMKLAYLDAAQGESRCVGAIEWNLFNDPRYLDACESGDLHTVVAKLCWPELAWTGDLDADRRLAEEPYYRHFSRRFMCKKIGHGTNYGGGPKTLAAQSQVDIGVVEDFQPDYFEAFPAHQRWHRWVDNQLRQKGWIVSLSGRRRQFWGRRNSPDTLRAAIAYDPQGSLADIVNNGMLNVWRERTATLLMQCHDAVVIQYPQEQEDEIIPKVRKQLEHTLMLRDGRQFTIPYDCQVGWNWGKWTKENPDGLREYKVNDRRKRQKEVSILDQPIRRVDRKR